MTWFRDFVYLVALAAWTGAGVYFTFAATPAVFARFARPMAGDVVGALFPGYYRLAVAAAVVLVVAAALRLAAGRPAAGVALGLAAAVLVANGVGGFVLQPRIHELRISGSPQAGAEGPDPGEGGMAPGGLAVGEGDPTGGAEAAFRRLHGLSMGLNLLSILAALALWGVVAARGL